MKPIRVWDQHKYISLTSPAEFSADAFSVVDLQKEESRKALILSLGIADEDTFEEVEEIIRNEDLIYKRRTFSMKGWKK